VQKYKGKGQSPCLGQHPGFRPLGIGNFANCQGSEDPPEIKYASACWREEVGIEVDPAEMEQQIGEDSKCFLDAMAAIFYPVSELPPYI
jgi:hypothetical protein